MSDQTFWLLIALILFFSAGFYGIYRAYMAMPELPPLPKEPNEFETTLDALESDMKKGSTPDANMLLSFVFFVYLNSWQRTETLKVWRIMARTWRPRK